MAVTVAVVLKELWFPSRGSETRYFRIVLRRFLFLGKLEFKKLLVKLRLVMEAHGGHNEGNPGKAVQPQAKLVVAVASLARNLRLGDLPAEMRL